MQLRVSTIRQETPDSKSFCLVTPLVTPSPVSSFSFLPGQFLTLTAELWNPKRNRPGPVHRAFSISSSPLDQDGVEIAAKRYEAGRMTPWLHDTVHEGQMLDVKGPDGEFVFREGETDELILIAGGIGIAPFRSMIRYIVQKGLPVQVRLLYSARTPADFAFADEFNALAARAANFRCLYTVTRPATAAEWSGRVGRVDEALLREQIGSGRALYYLCGPNIMINDTAGILLRLGVDEPRIRFERW